MKNPYEDLPENAFWKTAVAERDIFELENMWKPKFEITKQSRIATSGSCFAQHISKVIRARGFRWVDSEPAPLILPESRHKEYNYGVFSFRTGNLYTVACLKQWVKWALGKEKMPKEVWRKGEAFIDPFRPAVEPKGYVSEEELLQARLSTLNSFRIALKRTDVFVFTLGLTEGWINKKEGYSYPMCPGTIAGEFDDSKHEFVNFTFDSISSDLNEVIEMLLELNPEMKFLFTVSPVPLTATASDKHVLVATTYSKSVLRAVAGEVARTRDNVDYFPSYEIINSFYSKGIFYHKNLRNVTDTGVDYVMRTFLKSIKAEDTVVKVGQGKPKEENIEPDEQDLVCEEMVLEGFNASSK